MRLSKNQNNPLWNTQFCKNRLPIFWKSRLSAKCFRLFRQSQWDIEQSKRGSLVSEALIRTDSLWQAYSLSQQVLTGCKSRSGIVCSTEKWLTLVWQSIDIRVFAGAKPTQRVELDWTAERSSPLEKVHMSLVLTVNNIWFCC